MRISGKPLDRWVSSYLPLIVLFILLHKGVTAYLGIQFTDVAMLIFDVPFLLLLLLDLYLHFNKPTQTLYIREGKLFLDEKAIEPTQIVSIKRYVSFKRYQCIRIVVDEAGETKSYWVADKPSRFWEVDFWYKSVTLTLLFRHFPDLENKISLWSE